MSNLTFEQFAQYRLDKIYADYENEARGLGKAYRVVFENESALPPDCFDAISDNIKAADILDAGAAKVKGWINGMMSQFGDGDIYDELIDEELPGFMEMCESIAEIEAR